MRPRSVAGPLNAPFRPKEASACPVWVLRLRRTVTPQRKLLSSDHQRTVAAKARSGWMRVALICNNVELSKAVLASLNANGIRPLMLANDQCHSLFRASRFVDRLWKVGEEFTEAEQVAAVLKDCHVDFGIDQLLADNVVGLRVIDDIRREIKIPFFPM